MFCKSFDVFLQLLEVAFAFCPDNDLAIAFLYAFVGSQNALKPKIVLPDDVGDFLDRSRPVLDRTQMRLPPYRTPVMSTSARKMSLSEMMPTTRPWSSTGRQPMFLSSSTRAASSTGVSGVVVIDLRRHDVLHLGLCKEIVELVDVEGRGFGRAVFLNVPVRKDALEPVVLHDGQVFDPVLPHDRYGVGEIIVGIEDNDLLSSSSQIHTWPPPCWYRSMIARYRYEDRNRL